MTFRQMLSEGISNAVASALRRVLTEALYLPKGAPGRRRPKQVNRALIKQRRKQKHRSK